VSEANAKLGGGLAGPGGEIGSIADPEEQRAVAQFGPQMGHYIGKLRAAMKAAHAAGDNDGVRMLAAKLQAAIQAAKAGGVKQMGPNVGRPGDPGAPANQPSQASPGAMPPGV